MAVTHTKKVERSQSKSEKLIEYPSQTLEMVHKKYVVVGRVDRDWV